MSITNSTRFQSVATPRLPKVSGEYDPSDFEQYSNVLRLYFNQLNNIVNQIGATTLTANSIDGVAQIPTIFTVSTLPSATLTNAGVRSFVSDATTTTFGSVAIGGGTNTVPIYCDGTNWLIG